MDTRPLSQMGGAHFPHLPRILQHGAMRTPVCPTATLEIAIPASTGPQLLAWGPADESALDVYAVADELHCRGWYVDRQTPPPSLHCTVNAVHEGRIEEFAAVLRDVVGLVAGRGAAEPGAAGTYGTVE